MRIVSGSTNPGLARAVARELGEGLTGAEVSRFPDGEVEVVVDPDLRGQTVYIVQPTGPPANDSLLELLLLTDAVRRCGSARTVAVVPYLGYARQDRRTQAGQPVGVRVVGEMLATSGVDHVVVMDPHSRELEAIFPVPVESVTAVPLLAAALTEDLPEDAVVVAPDLGATNLAERFAELLDLEVAVVRKTRLSGDRVRADAVVGDVAGRHPIIVDDMISTGGTIAAAVDALRDAGSAEEASVATTHGVFAADAAETLGRLPLRTLTVTDTLPTSEVSPEVDVVPVAALLADVIGRLESNRRLDDLEAFR